MYVLGLKLILKVGGSSTTSTPERSFDTTVTGIPLVDVQEEHFNSPSSSNQYDTFSKAHKKSKKKKKKKEKDYEKRDKKKKHRKVRVLFSNTILGLRRESIIRFDREPF